MSRFCDQFTTYRGWTQIERAAFSGRPYCRGQTVWLMGYWWSFSGQYFSVQPVGISAMLGKPSKPQISCISIRYNSLIIANGGVIGGNCASVWNKVSRKTILPDQWLIDQGVNMAQPAWQHKFREGSIRSSSRIRTQMVNFRSVKKWIIPSCFWFFPTYIKINE